MAGHAVFARATVSRIVKETADAVTFVLEPNEQQFSYLAGQYCTFRVRVDGEDLYRSYSMSSAPETDTEIMTTVKRVPGGKVSNWLLDHVAEGDHLYLTRPAGKFCLSPTPAPLLGFSGGSGITPILSLAKSALATTDRSVRLLCADRDPASAIFETALAGLVERYPGRLAVVRHFDDERGLLDAAGVLDFVGDDLGADNYVCGPEGFMALVQSALPGPGRVLIEHFDIERGSEHSDHRDQGDQGDQGDARPSGSACAAGGTVTIVLDRKKVSVPRSSDETLLESARRAGLSPPFSCEAGNCGTCMAMLTEGHATMRANDVLDDDEVAEGYVLTCQGVPDTESVTVVYE
jgi:3-ketosteroid 9alpha-monooxygenase subunit B